jgi:two-component system response regulator FlrC
MTDPSPKRTVVVVEDDDAWRSTIADWLKAKGCHVLALSRGDWVTTALKTYSVDAVILDVHLPGPSGLEVLRSLRLQWPVLPVIITTAFGGPGAQAAAIQDGATAYLEKPFSLRRLTTVMDRVTRTSGTST